MAREPNEKEILVEAIFRAFKDPAPRDLELFSEPRALRATIGGERYRISVGGMVERMHDGILQSSGETHDMGRLLKAEIAAVVGRLCTDGVSAAPRR